MRRAAALCLWLLWPALAAAQSAADFEKVLRLPDLAGILAQEAAGAAEQVDADLLAGQGGTVFAAQIAQINAPERLAAELASGLADALPPNIAAQVLSFWQSPQGQRIIALELSARRAFLDPEVEAFAAQEAPAGPYTAQIDALIASGDMIARNRQTAALTAAAFYRGLREGRAVDMTDAQIDEMAREQAAGSDGETRDWLTGFFTLAYSPLEPAEMDVLVAFWETEAGLAFSDALYDVFDAAFAARWFATGRAAALFLNAEDI